MGSPSGVGCRLQLTDAGAQRLAGTADGGHGAHAEVEHGRLDGDEQYEGDDGQALEQAG
jgi:hypothetical protein